MSAENGIAFILPLYTSFVYGRRAAESFFKYTPVELNPFCIVLDDASPNRDQQDWEAWANGLPADRLSLTFYPTNGGLTRSWNAGLVQARGRGLKYAIAGNSDVLFTEGWYEGLLHNVDAGRADLIGPLSNAPGRNNRNRCLQQVARFLPGYELNDSPSYLNAVANRLREKHSLEQVVYTDINGFFMLARTDTWWRGRFDEQHVFDPSKKMTSNEDELQRRWAKQGLRSAFTPTSFIFHYRGVSRGHRRDDVGVYRLQDARQAV